MRLVQVANVTRGQVLGSHVHLADRWWLRLRGLVGRPRLESGEGMLLSPCKAVHMHGMKYPLDVVLLDRKGVVVALYPGLPPGGKTRYHRNAYETLELPVGTLNATATGEGDTLVTTQAQEPFLS